MDYNNYDAVQRNTQAMEDLAADIRRNTAAYQENNDLLRYTSGIGPHPDIVNMARDVWYEKDLMLNGLKKIAVGVAIAVICFYFRQY